MKLDNATIAYNRFKIEKDNTIRFQLLSLNKATVLSEVFLPKAIVYNKPWKEFMTVLKFRFRRDHKINLPATLNFSYQLL
jgi:hypothetical protein